MPALLQGPLAIVFRFAGTLIRRIRMRRAEARAVAAPATAAAAQAAAAARRAQRMEEERARRAQPPQHVVPEAMDTAPPGQPCAQKRARDA